MRLSTSLELSLRRIGREEIELVPSPPPKPLREMENDEDGNERFTAFR